MKKWPTVCKSQFIQCTNPKCLVHLHLHDHEGKPLAVMTFDEELARDFIRTLQDMLYERTTEKD